ncbi:MAG: recombinase family protein [Patescibacteria group bacterium]|jgi:DNA invertase Pin-like site-specific DNA recombinase
MAKNEAVLEATGRAKGAIQEEVRGYCLYARKSSESDERQALSIDSQIKEMEIIAQRDGIKIVDIIRESHSAKESGQRPVYKELLQRIREKEFTGILTWAPDRLSRNAGDLGELVDLMDQGLLEEIRTHGQVFHNSPNEKFLLMILCSQAKLENDNRGINAKRGMKNKCDMGWRPGVAPPGYLNDKTNNTIMVDPEKAPIIKEMFNKVAKQGYSGRDVYDWLNNDISWKGKNGKKMSLSNVYTTLKNTFYYGEFEYGDIVYQGKQEPLISKELFAEVQERIATSQKGRYGQHCFNFTKMIICGACGAGITAEEKFKRLQNGDIKKHVYYHCCDGKRKRCRQPYIREADLLEQFVEIIDKIEIDRIGMRKRLQEEIDRFNKFTQGVLGMSPDDIKTPKIDIRAYAKYMLREGTTEEKREILDNIKTSVTLLDKKLILHK